MLNIFKCQATSVPIRIKEYTFIHSSVLWLVHSIFRRDYATECGLLLTPYSSSSRPHYHSFNNVFLKQFLRKMWPVHIAFLLFAVSRIVLPSLTLCNPYSFFTRTECYTNNLFRSLVSFFRIKLEETLMFVWSCILNMKWRVRPTRCNKLWFINNPLVQHILGIIMPIFRSARPNVTAYGFQH